MTGARIIVILTIIGVLSGGSLAVVFSETNPLIQENRRRERREAVKAVIPGAEKIEPFQVDNLQVFRGLSAEGDLQGYAFEAEIAGFQGTIRMMVGTDAEFEKITGLVILENTETPGLGNKIADKFFRDRFAGLSAREELALVKNEAADKKQNEVEAITGATISSRAVVDGANARIDEVRKALAE